MSLATNYRLGPQIYQFSTDSFGEFVLIVLGCVVLVVMAQHQLHRVGLYAQRHIFRNKRASLIESAFPDFCYQPFLTSKDVATKIETAMFLSHVSFEKQRSRQPCFIHQRSRQPCFFHKDRDSHVSFTCFFRYAQASLSISHRVIKP
jgi:hypothetical protein